MSAEGKRGGLAARPAVEGDSGVAVEGNGEGNRVTPRAVGSGVKRGLARIGCGCIH